MTLTARLARLTVAERWLLAEAAISVPLVRLALTILPFRFVHRGISAATCLLLRERTAQSESPERIAVFVDAVATVVPHATCLTRALAATLLLARRGHPCTLRVGVAKNESGRLRAHAWLECDGRTILGGPDTGAFVKLPPVALSHR